jgi:hypothetical protein
MIDILFQGYSNNIKIYPKDSRNKKSIEIKNCYILVIS